MASRTATALLTRPEQSAAGLVAGGWPSQQTALVSAFPLPDAVLPKALLWTRALRRRAIDYWYATVEDLDAAQIEAALAAVVINILDEAVFEEALQDPYRNLRRRHPQGRVVLGLELIRNCEVHSPELASLEFSAAFGVPRLGNRVVLQWPTFDALPRGYRTRKAGEGRARGEARDAYQKWVAGRPVIETLLDAVAFFEATDSRLRPAEALHLRYAFHPPAPLGADGEELALRPVGLDGYDLFLPDLACRSTERRSAGWPAADRWLQDQDRAIRRRQPGGNCRQIQARIEDPAGKLVGYVGLAGRPRQRFRTAWAERASQVRKDVGLGFRYFVLVEGEQVDVVAPNDGGLTAPSVGGDALRSIPIADSQAMSHLTLNEEHPDLYRLERLAY